MVKRIVLLTIIFILGLSAPSLAAEIGSGVITGQVVNGTVGGDSVADIDITLKTYLNDSEVSSTVTKTDAEGAFIFEGLSTEPNYDYQITLTFQQADYNSSWLSFDDSEETQSVIITVFDSTTSEDAIMVATAHTIMYIEQGNIQAKEYFLFINESDRTYIGPPTEGDESVLKFPLPEGAAELQPSMGLMECCIINSEDGFAETMPLQPGGKEVAYSYIVPYDSGKYTFSRMIDYPIANYDLLVQGEGIKVENDQLMMDDPLDIGGIRFNHLSGGDFAPGNAMVVRLSGLPETGNQGTVKWVALALLVLIFAFSSGYLLKRKRAKPLRVAESLDQRRQRLLVELAQLDDDFEVGKMEEEVYHRLRAKKKAQLVELM